MEQPLLRLGLLGFDPETHSRLTGWAEHRVAGWPSWRTCDLHMADAWMMNGSSVEVLGRDEVLIRHPHGSGARLSLNRVEVDRPLAFALPLPEGFASAEEVDAADEHSVRQRLQRFEAWLRPLRAQFTLGALTVARLGQHQGVVQLQHEGRLLAVVDFERWQAGLLIPARPVDLEQAQWVEQQRTALEIPPSFMRLPLHRVLWTYAVRTTADVLPRRYREKTIHLRRVPRLPVRWFDEGHLQLMRSLLQAPASHADLLLRTGWTQEALSHRLAALFYAGGLTTDADSARRAESAARQAMLQLQMNQNEQEEAHRWRPSTPDQMAPSSILREAPSSPLRSAGAPRQGSQTPES